ncbi:MAG: GNAT family N-acetyltransferase [Methylococcales bacterium]
MINIRVAKPDDIPKLVELLTALFTLETDFVVDTDKQASGLSQLLNNDHACVLVAYVEPQNSMSFPQQVVGMCSIQTLISTAEGGRVGLLEDLIVAAEFRQQGIATKLLAQASDWAERGGLKRLQLLADKTNLPALGFYARQGWQTTQMICLRKFL